MLCPCRVLTVYLEVSFWGEVLSIRTNALRLGGASDTSAVITFLQDLVVEIIPLVPSLAVFALSPLPVNSGGMPS